MPAAVQEPPAKKASKRPPKKSPAAAAAPPQPAAVVRLTPALVDAEMPVQTPPVPLSLSLLPEVADALQNEARKRGVSLDTVALDALHRGLRQMLWGDKTGAMLKAAGLVPRKPLPPGKTLKEVMDELRSSLPPDEDDPYTDEDYLRVMERD